MENTVQGIVRIEKIAGSVKPCVTSRILRRHEQASRPDT